MPVKIAITGLGFTHSMIPGYLASADTEVVLLHDIDEARARKISEAHGGLPWTLDYQDVLSSEAQIVEVGTPNHLHAAPAIAALEAGKHVLVEKPLAQNVAECRRMIEAARRANRLLGVNMTTLNVPYYHSLKAMIAQGLFGKIASVRIRAAHRGPLKRADGDHWRFKKENIGGGSFMQLAIHPMNMVEWALDDEIVRVAGFARNLYCRHSLEGEDTVAASGQFARGPLIAMESGYNSIGPGVGIYGTAGHYAEQDGMITLEANAPYKDAWLEYPGPDGKAGERVFYPPGSPRVVRREADFPHLQHLTFARAVRDGVPFEMNGEIGLRDVAIIQAIYQAAETGRVVDVKEMLG